MNIKEEFSFTNNRQIWRLIPAGKYLIIEERDTISKEVFFNCVDLNVREIFRNFQPEEKFWIGIETVYNDIIYMHKFGKPDMPGHKEIVAVDLYTLETLWNNSEYSFLGAYENKIYSYKNLFEGREYYILNYRTGEVLETLSKDQVNENEVRAKSFDNEFYKDAYFPEICRPDEPAIAIIMKDSDVIPAGHIECIKLQGHSFISYHVRDSKEVLKNIFAIVEINSEKVIFKEVLNFRTEKLIPENFFIKGNKLLLIKEKSELKVYSIT